MTTTHSPTVEELMAYLDGELSAAASRDVLAHLATCDTCQRMAGELRQVSADVRTWRLEEPPVTLRPNRGAKGPWRHGVGEVRRVPSPRWVWRFAHAPGLTAAAAVVLVVAAITLTVRSRNERQFMSAVEMSDSARVERPRAVAGKVGAIGIAAEQPQAPAEQVEQPKAGPSIVRTVTLRIVASDFAAVRPAIDRALRDMGGFVGQLGATDSGDAPRSIHATLRVPAARLDEALAALKKLGRVINESQQADDVTEQVVDLEVRIANARITEKRLTDLIQNRTGRVSDVLEAEREMARVRTELERLDAQRKNLGQRVAYATLVLEVLEERRASVNLGPVPVPSRLRHAIADGFERALSSVLEVALFLLRAGPSLVLWATLIGLPAWWILRRRHLMNP